MKILLFLITCSMILPWLVWSQSGYRPAIPKTWDEAALADWATPLAGLNVRPTHMSSKEYWGPVLSPYKKGHQRTAADDH